jgi:hypothetical protein
MRDRAIALAQQGFRVFPLKPNSKLPAVREFHIVASRDPAVVYAMWTDSDGNSTDNNIGISGDGLLILDVDTRDGRQGEVSLQKVVAEYGLDLHTVEARTPTGGRHLFYRLPPGEQVRNSCDLLGPGLDVRGYHGYVVGVGSVVPKGEYTWVRAPWNLWTQAPAGTA